MSRYEVIIKINALAKDEIEAKDKAWEFLCSCNKIDIYFDIKKQEE